MNIIVFDLEWNQSPIGQAGEHPRMPFEIIEIGAVKLDEHYHIIDEFRRLIKPKLYPTLHKYIRNILNYDEKELRKTGVDFKVACSDFLRWCETDESIEVEDGVTVKVPYSFCTWGPSDLNYLQTNMDFYRMEKLPFPLKFYDIQQIYADKFSKDKTICKLEKAVERLKIEHSRPFHAAVNDAYYTAMVLQKGHFGNIEEKFTFDVYRHPKNQEESITEYHNKVLDHISGEYDSRCDAMNDPELLTIRCSRCGGKTTKRIDWFQNSSGVEYAVGRCFRHGNMLASMRFKPASDSSTRIFAVKKIVPISKTRYKEVKAKHDQIEAKQREKYMNYRRKKNMK